MISQNNKRRTLQRLAVTRAWFDPVPGADAPRYALHMDVAFQEERLGGGEGDPVRFRVALKRCEIVVVIPLGAKGLRVDPRTIASGQGPATVSVERRLMASSEAEGSVDFALAPAGAAAGVSVSASAKRARELEATTRQSLPVLLGTRSLSQEGDPSWTIKRTDGTDILEGMLWDARQDEPRFELVDRRPIEERDREHRTGLHTTVKVEVRCKREDLEITDIALTDQETVSRVAKWANHKKKAKVAEAFIKHRLQQEGLRVGDIHEPFSDLVVGDLLVSLVDGGDDDDLP